MRNASHCGSKQQQSSHAMITLLLLVHATYIYGVVLHAHPVRGESNNQRNTTGKVATVQVNRSQIAINPMAHSKKTLFAKV